MSQHISRRYFSLGLAGLGATALSGPMRTAFAQERSASLPKILCFVGGYTKHGPPGISGRGKGIEVFEMERETGVLTQVATFMDTPSPSFIVLTKDRKFLYALSEINDYNAEGDGCVTAYSVDTKTGNLIKINTVSSGGAVPAHLSVHSSGKFVLVANYMGGCVAVLPIQQDGSLGEATDVVHNTGPRQPERAEDNPQGNFAVSDHSGSHPHMIDTDPSGRFVIADDAGLDRVYVWTLNEKNGKLTPAETPYYNMTPGSAPRHFVFDHSGRIFYNLCEQNSKVVVSKFDPQTGKIEVVQSVSTVTSHFRGSTLAAEILIAESGKYVYVSNRLGDSMAVFEVGQDGTLTLRDEVWMHADYGRAMMFAPGGDFLFCANQRSDSVTAFRVDRETGKPEFTDKFTPVGSPTTFAFMVADAS